MRTPPTMRKVYANRPLGGGPRTGDVWRYDDRSDASDPVFLLRALKPRHKLLEVSGFKGVS
jgi:hypothetical protein